jgi:SSS family solute:Na+ symporter
MQKEIFTSLDLFVFVFLLILVMIIGIIAGKKEETGEDYFLAGHSIPWWAVAGSIFGTNVSANHLVGMLGVGFSIGFAQSHYELGAIFALLLLAYGFLPVYLKMGIYTLSEYLGQRYSDTAQLLYSVTMLILILIQMVSGFYIGSRSMLILFKNTPIEMSYSMGVWVLVILTGAYTVFGGIKAVIYTDVLQSILLLLAGVITAYFTFTQTEIGGFFSLLSKDSQMPRIDQKFHLYLPSSHPELPWTGAFSGLLLMHFFYWGTNQYLVQRALAAKSIHEARIGILLGGYLKLLIPFFSISTGIAAYYLFQSRLRDVSVSPDSAFPLLVGLVVPIGYGLVGLISAGLLGAIFSTIDSMMNSASTLLTIDIYKKFINQKADDKKLIQVGQISVICIVILSAFLAILTYTPDAKGNFFLKISALSSYFIPGLLISFILGIFSARANSKGAISAITLSPIFGYLLEIFYESYLFQIDLLANQFGSKLNFMHRFFCASLFALLLHFIFILLGKKDNSKIKFTILEKFEEDKKELYKLRNKLIIFILIQIILINLIKNNFLSLVSAGIISSSLCFYFFIYYIKKYSSQFFLSDRFFAAILTSITIFLLYYFA